MYEIFKNALKGQYELVDMLNKIAEYYIKGNLSKEEKEELENEARNNANPENSYAPLEERLNDLITRVDILENKVSQLEKTSTGEPTEEPTEPVEEYPEYVQPTGAHDAYNTGDKITYNDKHYECIFDGCVWNPDEYPSGWKEVTEEGGMSNEYEN